MKLETAIAFVGGDFGPTPGMLTNVIFRFLFNLTAAVACWVPIRLFFKNGELAGTAMVIATAVLNFYYALNAVIWHDNDIGAWPTGYGWCDIQLVSWIPLETLNAAAVCAVMQNISNQVLLMRASGLTSEERRRKHFTQALIIFPIPVLQLILYYFVIAMRYNISGIIGCQAVFEANWVFLTFFILPCPIFAVVAAYFASLTWWRYRTINVSLRRAMYSSGTYGSHARSARTKRKLYFMALTIVAPYCPMQLIFLFNNIKLGWPWSMPYGLAELHRPGWFVVDYAPSTVVTFVSMYINYIAVLEVVVFFLYFGRSEEAHEMYRKSLRAIGFGKLFPKLEGKGYLTDRPASSIRSWWPRAKSISSYVTSTHSRSNSISKPRSDFTDRSLNDVDVTQHFNIRLDDLDLEAARSITDTTKSSNQPPQLPARSPWVFRTTLMPHFEWPRVPTPAYFGHKNDVTRTSQSQGIQKSHIHALHLARKRSSERHQQRTKSLKSWNPIRDPIVSPGTRPSHAYQPTLVEDSRFRISAYERGSVSIKKDFSSSGEKHPSSVALPLRNGCCRKDPRTF